MKINEFNSPEQVDEGLLSNVFGDYGASTIADTLGKHAERMMKPIQQSLTQKNFINSFLKGASKALAKVAAPATRVSAAPAAPTGSAGPTAASSAPTAATATTQNTASTDPYENLKGQVRSIQPTPNAKPLPANMVASLQGDMQKLAKGDKESGAFAANKILKFANAGYDVSKLAPAWTASSKAGERFLTQSVYRAISKMLKEHGLVWANLGLRIRLTESVKGSGVFISTCKPVSVVVSPYDRLNYVLESIISEYEYDPTLARTTGNAPKPTAPKAVNTPRFGTKPASSAAAPKTVAPQAAAPKTVAPQAAAPKTAPPQSAAPQGKPSQILNSWFYNYMRGVNINDNQRKLISDLLSQVDATYSKDKGNEALQKLALLAFKLTAAANPKLINHTPPTSGSLSTSSEQIKASLDSLKNKNPAEYKKIIADINQTAQ
jgi:hypothetical protein